MRLQSDGVHTPWLTVYTGFAQTYNFDTLSTSATFTTTAMGSAGYFNLDGLSEQSVVVDEDKVFYLAQPATTELVAYKLYNGTPVKYGRTYDTGASGLATMPTINWLTLPNGDLLLDRSTYSSTADTGAPSFDKMKYNPVTKHLTQVATLSRPDERHSTGRAKSAAISGKYVYYVPSDIYASNGTESDLVMKVLDYTTMTLGTDIALPFQVKHDVSVTRDKEGNIYVFGGSGAYGTNTKHGELYNPPINYTMYKLNTVDNTWTTVFTLTPNNTDSYRYRLYTLLNDKFFIIDTTPDLIDGGDRYSYVVDGATGTVEATILNNPSREHLGITGELLTGDVMTISSTPEVTEAVSYLQSSYSDIVTSGTALTDSQRVADLVVHIGEKVYVRDPYRYDKITIEGDSLTNTGTLVWIEDTKVTEYYYNDLLVTRPTTVTTTSGSSPTWNRVVLVGDASLTTQVV